MEKTAPTFGRMISMNCSRSWKSKVVWKYLIFLQVFQLADCRSFALVPLFVINKFLIAVSEYFYNDLKINRLLATKSIYTLYVALYESCKTY